MSVLTVITISKNNPLGFKKTLDSLLNAGLIVSSVKLLVINGGSELLLKSELDDLDVLNSDNIEILTGLDFGIFNAMNLGLSKVPTQYVLFLNSGDEICRGFNFNHIIPEIIRLGSNWIIADAFFTNSRGEVRPWKNVQPLSFKHRMGLNSFPHHGTIYKTDFIKKNGGYDESTPFADWELSVRLSLIEPPTKIRVKLSLSEPFNYSQSFSNHVWAKRICETRMRLSLTSSRFTSIKVSIIYVFKMASELRNHLLVKLRIK